MTDNLTWRGAAEAAGIMLESITRERDELRAEVERLTLDNRRLTEMWDTDRESLAEENTRLRLTLSRSDSDEMQLLRAENERLKDGQHTINIAGTSPETAHTITVTCGLAVENERLRARLDAAERLIEVVKAREIGTAGGVGAALEAYDAVRRAPGS
jgi:1,6-anhydro-N-acetylmuramate kinase